MWSVVDVLNGNPHWEFPLILSTYGFDLERRMLNREFCMWCLSNYYSLYYTSQLLWCAVCFLTHVSTYNDCALPLLRYFFIISHRTNNFMDPRMYSFCSAWTNSAKMWSTCSNVYLYLCSSYLNLWGLLICVVSHTHLEVHLSHCHTQMSKAVFPDLKLWPTREQLKMEHMTNSCISHNSKRQH
jgi:hypothetical protein